MNNDIKNFLGELCRLDPDLKNYEAVLVKIITTMLQNKPDTKFDEQFKQRLRTELLAKIKELKKNRVKVGFWQNLKLWQGLSIASVAAVITLVVLIPSISRKVITENQSADFSSPMMDFGISQVSENAFGSLSENAAGLSQSGSLSSNIAQKISSGISSVTTPLGFGGGGAASTDLKMMPPYELTSYKFVYKGDDLNITETEMPVLKRVKGYSSGDYTSWLKNLNLGLIDAGQFANLKVQHLSLAEDIDSGYIIDITPFEGSINISQNWQKWNYDYSNVIPLSLNDVPDDQSLISLANDFLKKYKINLSSFGQPEVDNLWRESYRVTTDPALAYIPEIMTVKYPLVINEKIVYDQSGFKAGLFVNIDVRKKVASGLYGLFTQNYQSSNYAVETNAQRIKDIAEIGGLYGPHLYAEAQKTVEITLGTPTLQYMQFWQYANNENNELLLPAYVFPVESVSGDGYNGSKNVVVPLIKEILDSQDSANGGGVMPLIEKR